MVIPNKGYISFRQRQAFFELETRTGALSVRARAGESGAGIPESDRPHWEPTRWPGWWRRTLRSHEDWQAAWPAVVYAFEQQASGQSSSEFASPQDIREIQKQIVAAALSFGEHVQAVPAGRTTYLTARDQEFARLRKNETDGFVLIQGELTGGTPSKLYLRSLDAVESGIALLRELHEAQRA